MTLDSTKQNIMNSWQSNWIFNFYHGLRHCLQTCLLLHKIDDKSQLYDQASARLQNIFVMNNLHYVVQRRDAWSELVDLEEERGMTSRTWQRRRMWRLKGSWRWVWHHPWRRWHRAARVIVWEWAHAQQVDNINHPPFHHLAPTAGGHNYKNY